MAGTRLLTQVAFAAVVFCLFMALVDFDAASCIWQCWKHQHSGHRSLVAGIEAGFVDRLLQYDHAALDDSAQEGAAPLRPGGVVQLLSATALSAEHPRLYLNSVGLSSVCFAQNHRRQCAEALRRLEMQQVRGCMHSPRFAVRDVISINLHWISTGDATSAAETLFSETAGLFTTKGVGALRDTAPLRLGTHRVRLPQRRGGLETLITDAIPTYLQRRGDAAEGASEINLFLYFPAALSSGGGQQHGLVSSDLCVGLVAAGENSTAAGLSAALVLQLRGLLGLSAAADYGVFEASPGQVVEAGRHLGRTGAFGSGHAPIGRVSVWEARWLRLAYAEQVAGSLGSLRAEVELHCSTVWDWSAEQYSKQWLFSDYQSVIDRAAELDRLTISNAIDGPFDGGVYERALHLAAEIEALGRRIVMGEHLKRPNFFPFEFRIAVLAPFWVPIALPVVQGVVIEYRRYKEKMLRAALSV